MQWRIEVDVLKKEMNAVQQRCQQLVNVLTVILVNLTVYNDAYGQLLCVVVQLSCNNDQQMTSQLENGDLTL